MLHKFLVNATVIATLCFAGWTWYQHAWTFEDTFITYRVIDNFLNGYGLRWNVVERVQVFTHPLWLFLLTPIYYFTREVIVSTAAVSAICTLLSLIILLRSKVYRSTVAVSFVIILLCLTNTFPIYSSSGFENPLSHLIACAFFTTVLRTGVTSPSFKLPLLAALGILTRSDAALLYVPCLAANLLLVRGQLRRMTIAFAPLLAWELFRFIYFGSLLPNTALAKLPGGISKAVILQQGFSYVADQFNKDFIAAAFICISVWNFIVGICDTRKVSYRSKLSDSALLLNVGIVVYCLYIIWIGGDYLSHRFWSLPLLCSAITGLYWYESLRARTQPELTSRAVMIAWLLIIGVQYWAGILDKSQVTLIEDESKKNYFGSLRLKRYIASGFLFDHPWRKHGLALRDEAERRMSAPGGFLSMQANVGIMGYYAGPKVHIVDSYALTEPILARLPTEGTWRVGHFPRRVPPGYLRWLTHADSSDLPPPLKEYLENVAPVFRAPLLNSRRLRSLLLFSVGTFDSLLNSYIWTRSDELLTRVPLSKVSQPVLPGAPRDDWRNVEIFPDTFLDVEVNSVTTGNYIEISVDCDDSYLLELEAAGGISRLAIKSAGSCPGMTVVQLPLPEGLRGQMIRKIRIKPSGGDRFYKLGHLRFVN